METEVLLPMVKFEKEFEDVALGASTTRPSATVTSGELVESKDYATFGGPDVNVSIEHSEALQ
jgi:hypothetical protein